MDLTFKDLAIIYNALNAQKSNLSTNLTIKTNVETIRNIEDILLKFEGTKKD